MMQITLREPGSAITHFIGMLMAVFAAIPLLVKAGLTSGGILSGTDPNFLAMSIFMGSMILLYGASTAYHSVNLSGRSLRIFRKIDHMMIFVLIAGSYTPVCLIVLGGRQGYLLLATVWGIVACGILLKGLWIHCPKWVSSVIYITMGWVCLFLFGQLSQALPVAAFVWLLAGGVFYTAGGVIYALKLPIFNGKHKLFGSHEVFHLFVMFGSICHFVFMYLYVA
ncbi:MAG: hemolysin III family protein [Clostridium sp.]|jgi:hemolysin III|nr:hemolysin III family protein [Clostridium sp.]